MKLNTKPLADIPLGTPVIADGVYFAMMDAEVKPNRDGDNQVIHVKYKVIEPEIVIRDSGKVIANPGNVNIMRYVAFPKDESDEESVDRYNRQVKELAIAGGSNEAVDEVELSDLQNKIVKVKVGYEAAKDNWPERNRAVFTTPLAEGEEPPAVPF
jgi:hypothetical protein